MSDGYYNSKKTDDICGEVCGQVNFLNSFLKCFFLFFEISVLLRFGLMGFSLEFAYDCVVLLSLKFITLLFSFGIYNLFFG